MLEPNHPTTPLLALPAHQALRCAVARLEIEQARGSRPWALAEAYRLAATCYLRLGGWSQAVRMLEHGLQWARHSGGADMQLDLACELAETLAMQAEAQDAERRGSGRAARERARDLIFETTRQAAGAADPRWEVTLLLRLSDLLDRFGDRDDATELQVRALTLTMTPDRGARGVQGPRADDANVRWPAH